jgi:hypothetical protein
VGGSVIVQGGNALPERQAQDTKEGHDVQRPAVAKCVYLTQNKKKSRDEGTKCHA